MLAPDGLAGLGVAEVLRNCQPPRVVLTLDPFGRSRNLNVQLMREMVFTMAIWQRQEFLMSGFCAEAVPRGAIGYPGPTRREAGGQCGR